MPIKISKKELVNQTCRPRLRKTNKALMRLLLIAIAFLLSSPIWAQQEVHFFGFDGSIKSELAALSDGSYASASLSINKASKGILVLRFDACGDTLWHKIIGEDLAFQRLLGFFGDGTDLWLAAGMGPGADSAVLVLRLNSTGQLTIAKSIKTDDSFYWYRFSQDGSGKLYLTGNSTISGGFANTIIKIDRQGNLDHAFQYGQVFIWGMSTGDPRGGLLNINGSNIYRIKADGTLDWTRRYISYYQSAIPPIAVADGYIIFTENIGAIDRFQVYKIDLQGDLVWTSEVFFNISAKQADIRPNGNLVILYSNFGTAGTDWSVLELDSDGQVESNFNLPYSSGDFIAGNDIKVLPSGEILVHGNVQYNLATYASLLYRRLSSDIGSLSACPATPTTNSLAPSFLAMDSVNPNYTRQAFNDFTVSNFNPSLKQINLTENRYCGISPAGFAFSLGPDTLVCSGESFLLRPDNIMAGASFTWQNGLDGDSLRVSEPGLYWLEQSDACGGFSFRDSVFVDFYPKPDWQLSMVPEAVSVGSPIQFASSQSQALIWKLGDSSYTDNPLELIANSELFNGLAVEFRDSNNCLHRDTLFPNLLDQALIMPDAFSPNNDQLNDFFGPPQGMLSNYEMWIFDRFGKQQVYLENGAWDGSELPSGVYVYSIKYQFSPSGETKILRGFVTLIR